MERGLVFKRGFPALVIVAFLVAGFFSFRSLNTNTNDQSTIKVSGTIEADEAMVSAEVAERVKEIEVEEGDTVKQGDVVVLVDDSLLDAKLKEAEAATQVAQAKLAQIKAGAGDEAVAVARATLLQAQTAEKGANSSLSDVKTIRQNPQELNAKIDAAKAQVDAATYALNQAVANKDAAEQMKDLAVNTANTMENGLNVTVNVGGQQVNHVVGFGPGDIEKARLDRSIATDKWWATWEEVNQAQAQKDAADAALRDLQDMKDHPLQLDAQVNSAEARYREATAATAAANAQLSTLLDGATPEDLAIAEAQVEQADAAAGLLRVQKAKTALFSPVTGVVTKRSINLGEMAAPGAALVSVANLDQVTLTVYVPENSIGHVRPGQQVDITVDSFPGDKFVGQVSYISNSAEFTPKNVQTQQQRVNTVYAVKILLDNSSRKLKPGMPADATFEVAQ